MDACLLLQLLPQGLGPAPHSHGLGPCSAKPRFLGRPHDQPEFEYCQDQDFLIRVRALNWTSGVSSAGLNQTQAPAYCLLGRWKCMAFPHATDAPECSVAMHTQCIPKDC